MYAVIETGGKQYRVQEGDIISVEKLGLIEGEDGPYGLYVMKVNGIAAIYEEDGSYWAFYENGEYGMTGIDLTEIAPDVAYSFVQTKD